MEAYVWVNVIENVFFADFGMYRNQDDVYSFDEFIEEFLEESLLCFEKNYRKIL